MRLTEFYMEKQGRPDSKVTMDMDSRTPVIPTGFVTGVMIQASHTTTVTNINNYYPSTRTVILVDASANPVTVTLPTASENSGKFYIIKKIDNSGNKVTIVPTSNELIDGKESVGLTLQYQYVMMCCSGVSAGGSYWHLIGGGNVKIEEIISELGNEQISLLSQLLNELRQNKLHLASLSDAVIRPEDGDVD